MSKPSPYADPQPDPALNPQALSQPEDPTMTTQPTPTTSQSDPSTMSFRDRLGSNNLFFEAVRQSDLPPRKRLAARLAYRVPGIREDVDDFIESKVSEAGDVNAMANGDIIRIIIENLPAIIELLLKLFGG